MTLLIQTRSNRSNATALIMSRRTRTVGCKASPSVQTPKGKAYVLPPLDVVLSAPVPVPTSDAPISDVVSKVEAYRMAHRVTHRLACYIRSQRIKAHKRGILAACVAVMGDSDDTNPGYIHS